MRTMKNIFVPAGMLSTYSDDGRNNPQLATGYLHRTALDPFLACPAPDWTQTLGGGGIISTPSDIARFDVALLAHKYFDAAHLALMSSHQSAAPVVPGPSYALGWFVYPQNQIQHQGDFAITSTINAIYPDGTAVVEAGNGADLAPDFDRTYFATTSCKTRMAPRRFRWEPTTRRTLFELGRRTVLDLRSSVRPRSLSSANRTNSRTSP